MSMRCFIAVELDGPIRATLGRLQDRLRRDLGRDGDALKWVRPENIHLTLKFLGDVDDPLIPQVCNATATVAQQVAPFEFDIANVGCYGSADAARVLWLGITSGHDQLTALAQTLDQATNQLGFPLEARRFAAHLTLARIRNVKAGRAVHQLVADEKPRKLGTQTVDQLTVFQSVLSRTGPAYTPLHHAPLASKGPKP